MIEKLDQPESSPGDSAENDEAFYQRWSRRKQTHRGQNLKQDLSTPEDQSEGQSNELESIPPAKSDADMPPIESLGEDSEYSEFLSPNVSDKLRNLALRKLFHLPQFNIRDGLDDYDEDFTKFEVLGDVLTADRRHQMDMEAELKKQQADGIADGDAEQVENETPAGVEEEIKSPDPQEAVAETSDVQPKSSADEEPIEEKSNHHI